VWVSVVIATVLITSLFGGAVARILGVLLSVFGWVFGLFSGTSWLGTIARWYWPIALGLGTLATMVLLIALVLQGTISKAKAAKVGGWLAIVVAFIYGIHALVAYIPWGQVRFWVYELCGFAAIIALVSILSKKGWINGNRVGKTTAWIASILAILCVTAFAVYAWGNGPTSLENWFWHWLVPRSKGWWVWYATRVPYPTAIAVVAICLLGIWLLRRRRGPKAAHGHTASGHGGHGHGSELSVGKAIAWFFGLAILALVVGHLVEVNRVVKATEARRHVATSNTAGSTSRGQVDDGPWTAIMVTTNGTRFEVEKDMTIRWKILSLGHILYTFEGQSEKEDSSGQEVSLFTPVGPYTVFIRAKGPDPVPMKIYLKPYKGR